jgi:hypothetical protein
LFTDKPSLGFGDAGIIFAIHSPKKEPKFEGLGLSSPVGMHARVTIRQFKVSTGETQCWRHLAGSECSKYINTQFISPEPFSPMPLNHGWKAQGLISDSFPVSGGKYLVKQ